MTEFTRPATWDDLIALEGLLLTKESLRDKDRADRSVLLKALGRDA